MEGGAGHRQGLKSLLPDLLAVCLQVRCQPQASERRGSPTVFPRMDSLKTQSGQYL